MATTAVCFYAPYITLIKKVTNMQPWVVKNAHEICETFMEG